MRRSLLLLAILFVGAPTLAERPKAMTTCDEAWMVRFDHITNFVYHLQVDDPKLLIRDMRAALEAQGAVITRRSENRGTFELHAQTTHPIELVKRLQEYDPVWQVEQENRRPQNVVDQCGRLEASRRVAKRLEQWLSEDLTPHEKQSVVQMYQNHLRTVQQLDTQIRAIESNRNPHTIQIRATQKPAPQGSQAKK